MTNTTRYPLPELVQLKSHMHMPAGESPNAYLAGPMRGHRMNNFPAFFAAAVLLRNHGWGIENPAEYDMAAGVNPSADEKDWPIKVKDMLRTDFRLILEKCNAIILLPGWDNSVGAKMELSIAVHIGLPVFLLKPHRDGGYLTSIVVSHMKPADITFIERPRAWAERAGL